MAKLHSSHLALSEQEALDITLLISSIWKDPESKKLLQLMKGGSGKKAYEQFAKETTDKEVVVGLVQMLEELKALEVLFQDKCRAVAEMDKESMVPKDKWKVYYDNPELLEQDTQKGLFFTFLSLTNN